MDAGLNLELVVPHSKVKERVKLIRAESLRIMLLPQEGAVMAVLSHVDALLFKVELMGHDLQHLCKVLHAIRLRFNGCLFDRMGRDDDGASYIDLTRFHFSNGL